jgi:hypothetical protein
MSKKKASGDGTTTATTAPSASTPSPSASTDPPVAGDVLTNRNDNRRSSLYLNEKILSPANVNVNLFGKLFDRTVDGDVYAQPLVVSGLDIPKKGRREASTRNVVYVATTRNWLYAFDADDPNEYEPLWLENFGPPIPREDYTAIRAREEAGKLLNFSSELGIISTPVIRKSGNGGTIFLVARTKELRYDLHLMPPVKKIGEIPSPKVAKRTILLLKVGDSLHLRIFDGAGKMALDLDEDGLKKFGKPIDDLKALVEKLQPRGVLTPTDKGDLIGKVAAIVGPVPGAKKSDENLGPEYFAKVHAHDLATGKEIFKPSTIRTSVKATLGNDIEFDPFLNLNRPGLLLAKDVGGKDVIYSAWSSQGDTQPFRGWVLAHDADTLELLASHCTTPDWGEGGIWQSGNGLGADDAEPGYVYYVSGNGASDFEHGKRMYLPFIPIAPPPVDELDDYDLTLLTSFDTFDTLATGSKPADGKGQIILVQVDDVLHFFILNRDYKMVLGSEEKWLKDQGDAIGKLKAELTKFWGSNPLVDADKRSIIASIKAIVGPTLRLKVAAPGFGCSIVKLKFSRDPKAPERSTLLAEDFFTASDTTVGDDLVEGTPAAPLNDHDFDLCAGPVLFRAKGKKDIPLDLVIGGGKNGRFYVLDRKDMGHWADPDGKKPGVNKKALQEERLCHYHIHGAPVFWDCQLPDAPDGAAFVWSEEDHLRAYAWNKQTQKFNSTPFAISEFGFDEGQMLMPGGFIAISADGTKENTGIIWASHPLADANNATVPGVLRAYDPSQICVKGNHRFFKELWNSEHDPLKPDRVGMFAKYVPPVVANGKVYLATFSRQLVVFGELPDGKQPSGAAPCKDKGMGMGMGTCTDPSTDDLDKPPAFDEFYAQTVGNVEVQGSFAGNCDKLMLLAAGADIGGTSDEFQFYGQLRNGSEPPLNARSLEVVALVHSIQLDDPDTKAGVMIRVSPGNVPIPGTDKTTQNRLVPGSPHASMLITSDGRPMFIARGTPNAPSLVLTAPRVPKLPYFVRVKSTRLPGQAFYEISGSISSDGNNWQPVGNPVRIAAKAPVLFPNGTSETVYVQAGVVLAAHDDPGKTLDDLRTAIFREFDITDFQLNLP